MKVITHKRDAQKYISSIDSWNIDDKEKKKFKEFFKEYLGGRITQRTGNNPDALIEKVYGALRVSLDYLINPNKKKVSQFYDDLVVNKKIKSYNRKTKDYTGKPYPPRSQKEIIIYVKRYLDWRYKDADLTSPLNIKMGIKKQDIESMTIQEIETLYKGCRTNEERYIIAMLFSSGARCEEFLSLRICDVTLPQKEEFVKVVIRNETSKTMGRTISLYWPKTFEAIPEYINERLKQGAKPQDFILTRGYNSLKEWLPRFSLKVLKKRIHAHTFRHAAADWLASKMNRQQLCIYFGWSFSSPSPDIYIKRQNVNMFDVDQREKSNTYQEVQDKIERQELEIKKQKEIISQLQTREEARDSMLISIMNHLKKKNLEISESEDLKRFKELANTKPLPISK